MDIFDSLANLLKSALSWVCALLPDSPFQIIDNSPIAPYLPWINWFLPLSSVVTTMGIWLIAIGVYYAYSVLLRWVKAVG